MAPKFGAVKTEPESEWLPVAEEAEGGGPKHHSDEEYGGGGFVQTLPAAHQIPLRRPSEYNTELPESHADLFITLASCWEDHLVKYRCI